MVLKKKCPKSASMLLAGQRHICRQVLSIRMSCSKWQQVTTGTAVCAASLTSGWGRLKCHSSDPPPHHTENINPHLKHSDNHSWAVQSLYRNGTNKLLWLYWRSNIVFCLFIIFYLCLLEVDAWREGGEKQSLTAWAWGIICLHIESSVV